MSALDDVGPSTDGRGISGETAVGVALVAAAILPVFFGLPHDTAADASVLALLAWPILGLAGVAVLDRVPGSPLGRASVLAAALPSVLVLAGSALLSGDLRSEAPTLVQAARNVGPLALVPLVLPGLAMPRTADPSRARRRGWVLAVGGLGLCASTVAWLAASPIAFGLVSGVAVVVLSATILAMSLGRPPRPPDEVLLDLGLVAAALACALTAGAGVRWFAAAEQIVAPDAVGVIAATAAAAASLPLARWLRAERLSRRYGPGRLPAGEISALTAGLGHGHDPRDLLGRASEMVALACGLRAARILLDRADATPDWLARPLVVGTEQVGTLLVAPREHGGLEARDERIIERLLPTLALVARAVELAVDAEQARAHAVGERTRERARILEDLHHDLGPALAGMSMRVAAMSRRWGTPDLTELAADLATCRTDLRRIVADLTPSALETYSLPDAVSDLVASFGAMDRPRVLLVGEVPDDLDEQTAVLVYRTVAEGLTNVIRHASATSVRLEVVSGPAGTVTASVHDDGHVERVVPGTGLRSLGARAEQLGGRLRIRSTADAGTTLELVLPRAGR